MIVRPEVEVLTATLSLGSVTLEEGDTERFEIRLSVNAPVDLTFTLDYVGGGSAEVGDYSLSPTLIVIVAGADSVTVAVTVVDDSVAEVEESFELRLNSVLPSVAIAPTGSITVTILESDQPVIVKPEVEVLTATLSLGSVTLEEGDTERFEIRLNVNAPVDLTFTLDYVGGGSAEVGDYSLSPTLIVIVAGADSVTVAVTVVDDSVAEVEESFELRLNSVLPSVAIAPTGSITVTILENDQPTTPVLPSAVTATLSLPTLSVPEDEDRTFEIRLTGKAPSNLTFTLVGGPSGEYTLSPDPIVISKGSDSVIVTITAVNDTDPEPDEVFTLSLMSDPSSSLVMIGDPGSITITIPANDQPAEATAVEFVVTTASINEGDEYEIELRLVDSDGNALSYSQEIVVTLEVVTTPTDTTLSAGEYLLAGEQKFSTTVTIPANKITGTVLFQSVDDNDDESDKYITLRISAADQVTWQMDRTLRINVSDDDDPPPSPVVIGFKPYTYTVIEGAGEVTLTVSVISGDLTQTVTLMYDTADGSAKDSADYTDSTGMVTLSDTTSTVTFTVPIIDDEVPESTEIFFVDLTPVVSLPVGVTLDPATATVTITDDPLPVATLSTAGLKVEEGQDASFMILLSETATEDLEFELTRREGTATEGEDYSLPALPIVVPAGELGVTVTISTLSDAAYESTTVRFALTPETGTNVNLGTPSEILLEIEELFDAVLTFQTDGVEVRDEDLDTSVITEAGTYSETLRVVLRDVSPMREVLQELPDEYQHLEVSALADIYFVDDKGNTISDLDRGVTVTISVPISEVDNPERISFAVLHDGASEWELLATTYKVVNSEYVFETVSDRFSLFGLVLRDEPVIGFDSRTYRVNEASGTVELTVSVISGVLTETITLNYKTMDGSAIAGEDYTGTIGMITLSLMTPSVTISVDITEDATLESEEEFTVELSGAPVGVSFNPTRATVTIIDNDAVVIGFDSRTYRVGEDSGTVELTVKVLDGSLGRDVTLSYETMDGSAIAGEDYTRTIGGVLTLSAGATETTIVVDITDDALYEHAETFTVVLSGAPAGVTLDPDSAEVTITDDEPAPVAVIGFEQVTYLVSEEVSRTVLTVSVISGVLPDTVTLTYATVDGSATSGADYELSTGTLTLSPRMRTATIEVSVLDDIVVESAEMFFVNLGRASVPDSVLLTPFRASVTIEDNDIAIGFDSRTYRVGEASGTVELTVSVISGVLMETITLNFATSDGSAVVGDYTLATGTVTLSPMTSSVTFTVPIIDDTSLESEEEFTVVLSGAPADITLDPATATVTIIDNDDVVIGFDRAAYPVDEGGSRVELTVSVINGVLLETITLNFATSDGSAVAGADYALTTGTVTLTPMTPSVTFTVPITEDSMVEPDEMFTVELSGAPADITLDPAIATVTITNNDQAHCDRAAAATPTTPSTTPTTPPPPDSRS